MGLTVRIEGAVAREECFRFFKPVDWTVLPGEQWAVVGPNGAGKSVLAGILTGRIPCREGRVEILCDGAAVSAYDTVKTIEFRDIYSLGGSHGVYYQQRWNASETDLVPLAGEIFGVDDPGAWSAALPDGPVRRAAERYGIDGMLRKRIISLSSGELRKLLVIRALLASPQMLIIDNPFIGLDARSRQQLDDMLRELAGEGMQMVLLLSDPGEIPLWVGKVLPIRDMTVLGAASREEFSADGRSTGELFPEPGTIGELPEAVTPGGGYDVAVKMQKVGVRYGDTQILQGIDWEVRRGERWALLGPNGSGKSTLLSLVCGDNPQAYANRITLFDRARGSGESIWEIKRRIGHLNPDIHNFYLKDIPAVDVVASGLFDSVGLYHTPTPEQQALALEWLGMLGGAHLAGRSFIRLSFGEQRLALLARAMVKNPDLLILDEPLHGLDLTSKRRAREVVGKFAAQAGRTMIYVTHYPGEIPQGVDHTLELRK